MEEPTKDTMVQTNEQEPKIATTFTNQRPAIQLALIVLWRIYNKKYTIGSQLFAEEVLQAVPKAPKSSYRDALFFLEGAGAAVNEVIITDTVGKNLIDRYGLLHE